MVASRPIGLDAEGVGFVVKFVAMTKYVSSSKYRATARRGDFEHVRIWVDAYVAPFDLLKSNLHFRRKVVCPVRNEVHGYGGHVLIDVVTVRVQCGESWKVVE